MARLPKIINPYDKTKAIPSCISQKRGATVGTELAGDRLLGERRGNVAGSVLRAALREGKVVYERR